MQSADQLADDGLLDFTLAVIRLLPGTDSVGEAPKRGEENTVKKPNDIKVKCRLPGGKATPHDSDAPMRYITVNCNDAIRSKLECALELKRQLGEILGHEAVTTAESLAQKKLGVAAPPSSFFERMHSAQQLAATKASLSKQLAESKKLLKATTEAEQQAEAARIAAAEEVQRLQAALSELAAQHEDKKQRTEEGAAGSSTEPQAEVETEHEGPPLHHSGTNPPHWKEYWYYSRRYAHRTRPCDSARGARRATCARCARHAQHAHAHPYTEVHDRVKTVIFGGQNRKFRFAGAPLPHPWPLRTGTHFSIFQRVYSNGLHPGPCIEPT
jgi:hypothetical protein